MDSGDVKRILIISDNDELARCFLEEFQKSEIAELARAELGYSARNRDPSNLIALGGKAVDLRRADELDDILGHFDLVISAHCKQIFPDKLVRSVRCVNFHPGFNPFNRGWYPQVFSILNGAPLGVTVHEMTEAIDDGPIIYRQRVGLTPEDTSYTAYRRVIEVEKSVIHRVLPDVIRGGYRTIPDERTGSYNSIADYNALCRLDLDHIGSLGEHLTLLRALTHPPFQNAYFVNANGERTFVSIALEPETPG